jgi:hypothetical protein
VRADRPVREIERLPNLTIRHPLGSHTGDLQLLRGEMIVSFEGPRLTRFPGGAQLLTCSLAPGDDTKRVKAVTRRSQRESRLPDSALAAQPRTVRKE